MGLMPSWAMSGQAIDGVGDPHLAPGIHYRILINPLLGLPVVPISVSVMDLGPLARGFTRSDVLWVDSRGATRTVPFTVTADNPVTGYLPDGQTCCWAAISGKAATVGGPVLKPPVVGPLRRKPRIGSRVTHLDAGDLQIPAREIPIVTRDFPVPTHDAPAAIRDIPIAARELDPGVLGGLRRRPAPFRLEGVVATPFGDAPVARRSAAPYHVYASHLERLVVSGHGTVTGVAYLPAGSVTKAQRLRTTPLPISSGARYLGPANGPAEGKARVDRGAPSRHGMHESVLAATAGACAPASHGDEVNRVGALLPEAEHLLDRLINDTSAPPQALVSIEPVQLESGVTSGSSSRPVLPQFLQLLTDPGLARWLGTLDVDEKPQARPGSVIAYVIDAAFAPDVKAITAAGLAEAISASLIGGSEAGGGGLSAGLGADPGGPILTHLDTTSSHPGGLAALGKGPFLVGRVVLAATVGYPLDTPVGPALAAPIAGSWLPSTAPAARRELTVDLESLVPGAGLASAIAQPLGASPIPRNPELPPGRRLLRTASRAASSISATSGVLTDRDVGEQDGTWQVAQTDWFGRWSPRASAAFGPGTRPRPPRPVLMLTTAPPAVPTPVPLGPLAGTARMEVAVPPVDSLPAGGRLLASLRLTVTLGGSAPVLTDHPLPTPASPPEKLVITVPGPALQPAEAGSVAVTARWRDSAGVDSDESEPKSATMHDPRPPTPVILPPTLTYTARPDATGRARATLTWNPGAGQAAYRVFVADETTLRAKLEEISHGTVAEGDSGQAPSAATAGQILTALNTAPDAPTRGAIWNTHRADLPRRWWRQLTGQPIPRPGSGPATYVHDVSGSLTVLSLFRIVAVSSASVESDFGTSPLLPRAVPNAWAPPVPTIRVVPITEAGELHARITVTVPRGPTAAVRYRLRRASATSDAGLMQIVAEGAVPTALPGATGPQVFDIVDNGAAPDKARTSLAAWLTYSWRVEVQGAALPGGGPPGQWSSPSPAVAAATMPTDPPAPVTNLAVDRDAAGVHVRFKHPDPLAGGATNGYTVDVYRQLAGQSLRLLTSVPGQIPAPVGRGANTAGSFDILDDQPEALPGTTYRVIVLDPIGRAGPPSEPAVAP